MLSCAVRVEPPSITAMRERLASSEELRARPIDSNLLADAIASLSVITLPMAARMALRLSVALATPPDQTSK